MHICVFVNVCTQIDVYKHTKNLTLDLLHCKKVALHI